MDGKRLKDLIEKRSTIWTIGFCMTGIIVLGSIASLERAQRSEIQQETEAVPGEQALADDLTAGNDSRMQGDVLEELMRNRRWQMERMETQMTWRPQMRMAWRTEKTVRQERMEIRMLL